MKAESKKWLDAAIVLGRDPTAKVRCPVCESEYLTVRAVYPNPDSDNFEARLGEVDLHTQGGTYRVSLEKLLAATDAF